VVGKLVLETTFLVDLERESHRGGDGPAHRFLESRAEDRLCITVTTAGELAAGVSEAERSGWERLIAGLEVLEIDLDVCWEYGRAFQYLKANGLLIGTNDLWIGAGALARSLPLVTRNVRHFQRVPGLSVIGYAGEHPG